ncbi:MAG: hypothetical protein IH600_13440 [Bacteroidetes bacterium]|nr:hypothetical protein [Bacteroidota bacterium]
MMSFTRHQYAQLGITLLIALLSLSSCGNEQHAIPKEETGEPNTLPPDMLLFREARDTFLRWVEAFAPEHDASGAYNLLSAASRRALRASGVTDGGSFGVWFDQQADAGKTPFSYTFTRFDVLDIELQDTMRVLVTATFLVHLHQSTFESVGTFILRRERGAWVIPFAESGNYESSWWQKEKQFAMRMSEEGLSRIASDTLSLFMKYPLAWDVVSLHRTTVPTQSSSLPGVALQYIDPTSLTPVAFVRVAALPMPLPDSLKGNPDSLASTPLRLLRTERVTNDNGLAVRGELQWIADAAHNRYLLFYSAVDASHVSYENFSDTFLAIRKSILTTNEVLP